MKQLQKVGDASKSFFAFTKLELELAQLTCTCLKSTTETVEKDKICSKLIVKTPELRN